jgi:hypothetical protein
MAVQGRRLIPVLLSIMLVLVVVGVGGVGGAAGVGVGWMEEVMVYGLWCCVVSCVVVEQLLVSSCVGSAVMVHRLIRRGADE